MRDLDLKCVIILWKIQDRVFIGSWEEVLEELYLNLSTNNEFLIWVKYRWRLDFYREYHFDNDKVIVLLMKI